MHRSFISLFGAMVLASTAAAHDFWLQPDTFTPEGGAILGVTAKVGHSDDISEWPADPARIIAFRSIGESGIEDIQAALGNRHSEGRFDVATGEPGFYVLAIESIPSVSELPAEKFNTYVTDEGVRPIAIHRMENGLTETSGREIYSRRAKSIIRVGDAGAAGDAHLLRPIGMTLEVTPLANPALLEPGSGLPVEVRYRGSPLPGAMLHVVNLDPEIGDVDKVVTGADGRAVLSNLAEGRWMLQTVWSAPISGDVRGDYDTIFSSLTFEVLGTAAEGESAAMPGVNN